MTDAYLLIAAYAADMFFGDPEWMPHPVRWMGSLINLLDKRLRGDGPPWAERARGAVLVVAVVSVSACLAYLFIEVAKKINPILGNLAWVYLAYTTLSVKDLTDKAREVLSELKKGAIDPARKALSKIVTRNTNELDADNVVVSAIESVAESASDGITAPIFYLAIGGPVLAMAYKAANTLDSMVGYKNAKYIDFGRFAARLDDAANFIPARISGLLIAVSSFILGKGFKGSFRTMLRDGGKHPSPNSGIPEAAMAGALGIRLGGTWSYDGKASTKPFMGEARRLPEPLYIEEALKISFVASLLMAALGVGVRWLI